MLTVADMGEGGVKNHWKSAEVLYGWSLSCCLYQSVHFTCKNIATQSTKLSQTMQCSTFIIWLLNLPKGCGSYQGPYMAWPQRHLNSSMTSLKKILKKRNKEQNGEIIIFKKMRNCFTTYKPGNMLTKIFKGLLDLNKDPNLSHDQKAWQYKKIKLLNRPKSNLEH